VKTLVVFFVDKLCKIADTVSSRLQTIPAYHREPTSRRVPAQLDTLTAMTTDEVVRLIRDLPAKSSTTDYLPVSMLKSAANMMAPLIVRLANLSFTERVFPSSLKCG